MFVSYMITQSAMDLLFDIVLYEWLPREPGPTLYKEKKRAFFSLEQRGGP